MFWRHRKVLRDRSAGLVFDWRRGHGSARRLLLGFLVSAGFWSALLGYVRIRGPERVEMEDDRIDLTLVDLDQDENRWLSELIDRETLFQQRWDVSATDRVDRVVDEILTEYSPRNYEPVLQDIPRPEPRIELSNLPGWEAGVLPLPDEVASVTYAIPSPNWWIEVDRVSGPDGLEEFSFLFAGPSEPKLMSEGDTWTVVLAVDWRGVVVTIDAGWEKSSDPRTNWILDQIRARRFETLAGEGPLRVWRLRATLVNRPAEE